MNIRVSDWNSTKKYVADDVVREAGRYFFAARSNTSFRPSLYNNENQGGLYAPNAIWLTDDYFTWLPSYGMTIENNPRTVSYDNVMPYFQIKGDGINIHTVGIKQIFDNRTLVQAKAILAFLNNKKGANKFYFAMPEQYGKTISCICREWSCQFKFYNNFVVSANFEEVVV